LLRRQFSAAGLSFPETLTLAITNACNLNCSHCWVEASPSSTPAHAPSKSLRQIIGEFSQLGGTGLRLTGGEPLLHPDGLKILTFARSLNFSALYLQTNGNLINEMHAAALRDMDFHGLHIQISLDGACAASHDRVRGTGAFAGAMAGLKRLINAGLGPRLSLFFTEMRHNLAEIPNLLKLADDLGITSVVTGTLVNCGRADGDSIVSPAEISQYLHLLEHYNSDARVQDLYRKIGTCAPIEWQRGAPAQEPGCSFAKTPYLTAHGMLYPCLMCHAEQYTVAEVFNKGLTTALLEGIPRWATLQEISQQRVDRIPQCRICTDRDRCGAGCLGRTLGSGGDLFSVEDRCALRRAIHQYRKDTPSQS
jgi:radical SAM protein with 4Fe4S-binding SPASM domain